MHVCLCLRLLTSRTSSPVARAPSRSASSLRASNWLNLKDVNNKVNYSGYNTSLSDVADLQKLTLNLYFTDSLIFTVLFCSTI